jgi:hypothetical protein
MVVFCPLTLGNAKVEKNQGVKMHSAGFLFKIYPLKAIRMQLKTWT